MATIPLGSLVGLDLVLSSGLTLSTPDSPTRPPVPEVVGVDFNFLRPPVGYTAVVGVVNVPLTLQRSVASGADGHTVTLTLLNTFAPVFYTLDGSEPVNAETVQCKRYHGPFDVKFPTYPRDGALITVKAKAFALTGSGFVDSPTDTFQVQIPRKPVLVFNVDNTGNPLIKDITIIPSFSGAFTIRYTTDGTLPTGSSTAYTGQFQISGVLNGTTVIRAVAFPDGAIGLTGGVLQSDLHEVQVSFIP